MPLVPSSSTPLNAPLILPSPSIQLVRIPVNSADLKGSSFQMITPSVNKGRVVFHMVVKAERSIAGDALGEFHLDAPIAAPCFIRSCAVQWLELAIAGSSQPVRRKSRFCQKPHYGKRTLR